MEPDGTYPMPKDGWVCFHCGERFKKYGTARDHFGEAPGKLLQCRALRADLEAVAVAGDAHLKFDNVNSRYALTSALARPGVVKVLEGVKDG